MAQYQSKYAELGFRVNGARRKFTNGIYETTIKAEIAVLDNLIDAVRIDADEPKQVKPEEAKPETPKSAAGGRKSKSSSAK